MYTELIFGAELRKETPKEVIDALKYMLGETEIKPNGFPINVDPFILRCGSYYFGVNSCVNKMWLDKIDGQYHISTRSNCKNYNSEIQIFLEWIKPYIESGSGDREMYAIVIYEEASEPTIYYLYDNE